MTTKYEFKLYDKTMYYDRDSTAEKSPAKPKKFIYFVKKSNNKYK